MANGQTWKNILQGVGSLGLTDIINKPKTVYLPNPNQPMWTPPKVTQPNSQIPTSTKEDEDMQKYLIIGAVAIGAYLILKK